MKTISIELQNKLNEVVNGAQFNAQEVNEQLFEELVPASGNADTIAGEIVRAVNRIQYRWWNDGDVAGYGYGKETVNPAVRYLFATCGMHTGFKSIIREFKDLVNGETVTDDKYDKMIDTLIEMMVRFIATCHLWELENTEDMWNYKNTSLDVDDREYDEEDEY